MNEEKFQALEKWVAEWLKAQAERQRLIAEATALQLNEGYPELT